MRSEYEPVKKCALSVADAHAAENYVASQWTVRVSRTVDADKGLFKAIVGVLKGALPEGSYARLVGDARNLDDAGWVDKIPTHKLFAIEGELHAAIAENLDGTEQRYAWRMIGDHLHACQLYVSAVEVMIRRSFRRLGFMRRSRMRRSGSSCRRPLVREVIWSG